MYGFLTESVGFTEEFIEKHLVIDKNGYVKAIEKIRIKLLYDTNGLRNPSEIRITNTFFLVETRVY